MKFIYEKENIKTFITEEQAIIESWNLVSIELSSKIKDLIVGRFFEIWFYAEIKSSFIPPKITTIAYQVGKSVKISWLACRGHYNCQLFAVIGNLLVTLIYSHIVRKTNQEEMKLRIIRNTQVQRVQ